MAGRLLFVVLMSVLGSKPQMSVQHFTGDQVIFICSLPGSANEDTRCNLYFGETSRSVQTTNTSKTRTSTEQQICQFYFPIDDFLRRLCSVEQKDASCDYSLGSEHKSLSPRSDRYSLTDIVKKESSFPCVKSTVTTTKDLTVIRPRAFTTEAPLKSASDFVEKESDMTQTTVTTGGPVTAAGSLTSTESQTTLMFPTTREKESDMTQTTVTTESQTTLMFPTTREKESDMTQTPVTTESQTMTMFPTTRGLTVIRTHASTPVTPTTETVTPNVRTTTPVTSANKTDDNLTSRDNVTAFKTEMKIWKLAVVTTGFGTTVGVILLALILLCTKRRSESFSCKRTQLHNTDVDELMCMNNLNHGGLLPAGSDEAYSVITSVPGADGLTGFEKMNRRDPQNEDLPAGSDEAYSVITSVPGADGLTGSEKLNRRDSQNEDSDVYHVYSTISEDPATSAVKDMVYSTLQPF